MDFRERVASSFAILAEVYNRYMSCAHAYSTAPILMTFTAYIWAPGSSFDLHIANTIGYNGHVCILGFPKLYFSTEIEEMDVFALKARPLHDKKGCDLSKKSFLYLYVYTWDHKKHWYHRPLQIDSIFNITWSGHMKLGSGLVGSASTSPTGLVEKKVSVEPWYCCFETSHTYSGSLGDLVCQVP